MYNHPVTNKKQKDLPMDNKEVAVELTKIVTDRNLQGVAKKDVPTHVVDTYKKILEKLNLKADTTL